MFINIIIHIGIASYFQCFCLTVSVKSWLFAWLHHSLSLSLSQSSSLCALFCLCRILNEIWVYCSFFALKNWRIKTKKLNSKMHQICKYGMMLKNIRKLITSSPVYMSLCRKKFNKFTNLVCLQCASISIQFES